MPTSKVRQLAAHRPKALAADLVPITHPMALATAAMPVTDLTAKIDAYRDIYERDPALVIVDTSRTSSADRPGWTTAPTTRRR